ncbi:MAG: DUF222 domain-containing protein [Cryobacterium sp.]
MSQTIPSGTAVLDADPVERLREVKEHLIEALHDLKIPLLDDPDAIDVMMILEEAGRAVDAARVCSTTDVGQRAERDSDETLAHKLGCTNRIDLITAVTLVSVAEVHRRLNLGGQTNDRLALGRSIPPFFPAVAAGLKSGKLGRDSADYIVKGLRKALPRADYEMFELAERTLVANATGEITEETEGEPNSGIALPADVIRRLVTEWVARLDPDGVEPVETILRPRSTIRFGTLKDGLHRLIGAVTPEMRGVLDPVFDSFIAADSVPRFRPTDSVVDSDQTAGPVDVDPRSTPEKRAAIMLAMFEQIAADPRTPTMAGAAPQVMIHVNVRDLDNNRGVGWIDGQEAPISMRAVRQAICSGGSQGILFDRNDAFVKLGKKNRTFTPKQRLAISSRDGGCVIPGCDVPAYWTQIHHVKSWKKNKHTEIDNGVCLCRRHHAEIESSGWEIMMEKGRPLVRGPIWTDLSRTWRPAQTHRANRPCSL